jgi:hypothetical protein
LHQGACKRAAVFSSLQSIPEIAALMHFQEEVKTMGVEVSGLLGLLILVADIWAIFNVLQSPASTGTKVVWTLVILLLPLIGLVIWFLAGPRKAVP